MQTTSTNQQNYHFKYRFKGTKSQNWTWEWSFPIDQTHKDIERFGIPSRFFKPHRSSPEIRLMKKLRSELGLFKWGSAVKIDHNAMINYYLPYGKPLFDLMEKTLSHPSRDEKIQFLLNFVQDIDYGVPPTEKEGKFFGGISSPPEVLKNGWGDCDSKAVLFASILLHDPTFNLIFISVPKHLLVGIEGIPKPFQESVKYKGRTFIIAEPVGPRRTPYGIKNSPYSKYLGFIPIKVEKSSFDFSSQKYFARNLKSYPTQNLKKNNK